MVPASEVLTLRLAGRITAYTATVVWRETIKLRRIRIDR